MIVTIKCERCGGERAVIVLYLALCSVCDREKITIGRQIETEIDYNPAVIPGPGSLNGRDE